MPKKQWIQYSILAGLVFILMFTDLGKSIVGSLQGLLLKTGIKNAPTEVESKQLRNEASNRYPFSLALSTLDGKIVQLSDLKGKVVFLNQWATWCPPCRAEMPAIEELYNSVDKNKVAFVMLSLDEDPQQVREFVQRQGFTFPVYIPVGDLPAAFEAPAIPTTLILNPAGQIVQRIEGMANYDTNDFRNFLTNLASAGS